MAVRCCQPVPGEIESLRPWTFPAYRHLLDLKASVRRPDQGDRQPISPLVFVAADKEKLLGLIVGCIPRETDDPGPDMPNEPELLSVFVSPMARRCGVADLLVKELESAVSAANFPRITTNYMTGSSEIHFFEKLLAGRMWSPPVTRMRVLKCTIPEAKTMPWFQKYTMGKGFEFFPWSKMTALDMDNLKASHQSNGWIADDLKPWFYNTETLEASSSIGIRFKGELVGWVINHRMSNDTVRFTCSFLRRDLGRQAQILIAFSESALRAEAAGFKRMMFTVPVHHQEMARFAERWCAPWASFWAETRGSFKDLALA